MSATPLHRIERRVRRAIDEAADDGVFDQPSGPTRPLMLEADPHVPDDWRLGHKILADAQAAPAWIELGREIRREIDDLRASCADHRRRIAAGRQALTDGRAGEFSGRLNRLARRHVAARHAFGARVRRLWARIEAYNLAAPAGAPRFAFWPAAELEKFDAAWPWAKPTEPDAAP